MKSDFVSYLVGIDQVSDIAKKISETIQIPSILLLTGDLGAGKTFFVTTYLKNTHTYQEVSSPTFALHNQYSSPLGYIDHFDLYRIKNSDELESTGFWEVVDQNNYIVFIEWPEKIDTDMLPLSKNIYQITFIKDSEGSRNIEFKQLR